MHVESGIVSLLNGRTAVGSRLDLAGSFLQGREGERRNRIHPLGGGGGGGKRAGERSSRSVERVLYGRSRGCSGVANHLNGACAIILLSPRLVARRDRRK